MNLTAINYGKLIGKIIKIAKQGNTINVAMRTHKNQNCRYNYHFLENPQNVNLKLNALGTMLYHLEGKKDHGHYQNIMVIDDFQLV